MYLAKKVMTATLKVIQRSDGGSPWPGRSEKYTGEESSARASTGKREEGHKPDYVTVESPGGRLRKKIKIGTWNVRSLYQGKHYIVEKEMERTEIEILGICEHRRSHRAILKR